MNFLKNIFKKNTPEYEVGKLYAPVCGTCISLKDIPDSTFADGILGLGIGIEPEKGMILSPAEGIVSAVASTYHAIGITTPEGVELLIHVGLDTVDMNGEGFLCYIKKEQTVKFGEKLLNFDIDRIHQAGYAATVMFTVANSSQLSKVVINEVESVDYLDQIGLYSND
jgi:sucrose PTS system EIIBCA or EIIBC component